MSDITMESVNNILNTQRTEVWGIDNRTNERIEIAFGQLWGYDIPNYTTDTGVTFLGQNTGAGGDLLSDPLTATNGAPIAGHTYEASVRIAGQTLNSRETAPDGSYMRAAVAIIAYREGVLSTDEDRPITLQIVTRTEKNP